MEKKVLILTYQDDPHASSVQNYLNEKGVENFIGSWHLREDSLLMKSLENYKVIFPCNEKEEMLIKPPKNKKVFYCEKFKCREN